MSSNIDPSKLKVVELRAELSSRGLDTKGNKPVLVQRLKEALEKELSQGSNSVDDTEEQLDAATKHVEEQKTAPIETKTDDVKEPVTQEVNANIENVSIGESKVEPKAEQEQKHEEKDEEKVSETTEAKVDEVTENDKQKPVEQKNGEITTEEPPKEVNPTTESESDNNETSGNNETSQVQSKENVIEDDSKTVEADKEEKDKIEEEEEELQTNKVVEEEKQTLVPEESNDATKENSTPMEESDTYINNASKQEEKNNVMEVDATSESRGEKRKCSPSPQCAPNKRSKSPVKDDEPEIDNDKVQLSWYDSDLHLQVDKETFLSAKPYHDGAFGYVWAGVRATHGVKDGKVRFEVKITEKLKLENIIKHPEKRSRSVEEKKDQIESNPDKNNEEQQQETIAEITEEETNKACEKDEIEAKIDDDEKEPDESEENVEEKAEEETEEAEKVEDEREEDAKHVSEEDNAEKKVEMEVEDVVEDVAPTHLIRIGWSLASTDLQLGESEHSFGYESSGKFVNNKTFIDYGKSFYAGDVVGAYIEINEENVSIAYTLNGDVQGTALTFPKADLPADNCAFFPHILSKNYSFELNLGDREDAWYANADELNDYIFLNNVEEKIAGPARPSNRGECEVIMMCGLPGSGKTRWVEDYLKQNPDKKYTVLGNSFLLNKMTVNGNPLYKSHKDCWSEVLEKLTKSLNKLIEIASQRKRNYILDQTNVYPSVQRRKMRPFDGFKRRAVVVVVSDDEQKKRQTARDEEDDSEKYSENKILEMKAGMSIPQTGEFLDEIVYAELGDEEAKALVQKYNSQGKDAGYGPSNRNPIKSRNESRSRWQNKRDTRGGKYRDHGHHHRNNRYDRNDSHSRHGYWSGRSGGGGNGGGSSWNARNDRRENRISRDYRNNRSSSTRYPDRSRHESRKSGYNSSSTSNSSSVNRRSSYPSARTHGGGTWQSGTPSSGWNNGQGSSSSSSSWSGQGPSQSWQTWNQTTGNWNHHQSQYKPYNQQQGSYGQQSQQQQTQGYGYANWNYYGQYGGGQNWNSQGQSHSSPQSGHYNQQVTPQQQAWAQYSQQYNSQNSHQPVQK